MKWRYVYNTEGRHITHDEFTKAFGTDNNSNSDKGNQQKGQEGNGGSFGNKKGGKDYKKRNRKLHRTKTTPGGTKDSVRVEMKEKNDKYDSSSDDSDSDGNSADRGTKQTRRNPKASPRARRGRQPYARIVIDPGTDFEVIGGVGWRVIERFNRNTPMSGAFAGSQGASYPVVSAATIYEGNDGPILLGIGAAAWDSREEQYESLLNLHEMQKYGIEVNDKAERDGGTQQITVGPHEIPLVFEQERTLHFRIRQPTEEEINTLPIQWLIPKCQTATSSLLRRRNEVVICPELAPWRERVGFPPEVVMEATMAATTQLCANLVEMDN